MRNGSEKKPGIQPHGMTDRASQQASRYGLQDQPGPVSRQAKLKRLRPVLGDTPLVTLLWGAIK
jgi:hypothetical protein